MNVHQYRAQYHGGPCDGTVVVATNRVPEEVWSAPSVSTRRLSVGSFGRRCDAYRSIYRLHRISHLIDAGQLTIRFEYEFVGWEPVARSADSGSRSEPGWVRRKLYWLLQTIGINLAPRQPEGRPKRPGQVDRLLSCPGRGVGPPSTRKPAGWLSRFVQGVTRRRPFVSPRRSIG